MILKDVTFISLTNKTIDVPNNVITGGVNALSQVNAIKKFIEKMKLKKLFF